MSEPPIKQEEIIMEEVSSDGDIILIVGLEKKRIRVNSAFLRIASRVLDSMFGPNWAEGQNLSRYVQEFFLCQNHRSTFNTPLLLRDPHYTQWFSDIIVKTVFGYSGNSTRTNAQPKRCSERCASRRRRLRRTFGHLQSHPSSHRQCSRHLDTLEGVQDCCYSR